MAYLPKEHNETAGWKVIIYPKEKPQQQEEMKAAQKEQHRFTRPALPPHLSSPHGDITAFNSLLSKAIIEPPGC